MEKQAKRIHLFNCDKTFDLDLVELLFTAMKGKLEFDLSIKKHYFNLSKMSEMSNSTIPGLKMDFAVFVVHAHESRLSINEVNAGIGYAKIYRALLQATDDNVIIVIGGDDNYKDEDEENKTVLSRWAWEKISSQFDGEYLDGRKSFVFSWDEKHREIHEEALLHYFDQNKKGEKFEPKPKATSNIPDAKVTPGTDKYQQVKFESELEQASSGDRRNAAAVDAIGHDQAGDETGGAEESHSGYPDGSVLLETRLLYGKLSYDANNVKERESGWTPPEEIRKHLEQQYASTPEAEVSMVAQGNKIVPMVHVIPQWWQFWRRCAIL